MSLNSNSVLSKSISTVISPKHRFVRNIQSLQVAEVQKTCKTCKKKAKEPRSKRAIKYREADTKGLTIRTDNGPQFKSKATEAYISFTKG